ncbi:SDR family oxidoreductase [Candidatus Viridilinea mediisalina]|uniref:SDR family oxidoreductase n=1 Tax=Candidatus Viridilinea mediisalina TaxID=2024553 RepID=UPI0013FD8CDB|nr:NAD(P)H-binding protein [Candidatus Viridilinea mediisalina]
MKVLITGATGFTGSFVVTRMLEQGNAKIRCFVRPQSDLSSLPKDQIELAYGDLNQPETLRQALLGIDILVNLASLGFGHAPQIVAATQAAGVKRAIFMSTTAIFTTLNAASKHVRVAAEATIQSSSLDYTILRPTMIYGNKRDRNMVRLINYLQRWPVIPVFGRGTHLQQPVYVDDLARAVVRIIDEPRTFRQNYNLPGQMALTYNQVISTICHQLQRKVYRLHMPTQPVIRLLLLVERFGLRPPLKAEQIMRLNEDKAFDYSEASRDFDYQPLSFSEGIRQEMLSLGLYPNPMNEQSHVR